MNRDQKSELVSFLKDKLLTSSFVALVHYRGMSDKDLYDMRISLKEKGCNMKIAKNTLTKVALKGSEMETLSEYLNGPTALLYSEDVVALSKVLADTAKKSEFLKIRAGFFNNAVIDEAAIKDLAKLGSLEDVRASFIGVLKGAQSHFVRILTAPEKGLATLKQ